MASNPINKDIEDYLRKHGATIVDFADISRLPEEQNQGYNAAVVFIIPLSKAFIRAMRDGQTPEHDEYLEAEHKVNHLADDLANELRRDGYRAQSQSDSEMGFNHDIRSSVLPHKTVAMLAGLGYIGKNNLLITEEYGCALVMCTVLTDAPLDAARYPVAECECGDCDICASICPSGALTGENWTKEKNRDGVIDIEMCACTLKCMINCPKTIEYAESKDKRERDLYD